jgi:hypothetical protein
MRHTAGKAVFKLALDEVQAPEPVWTFWGRVKPRAPAGKSNLRPSSPQPSQYTDHATSAALYMLLLWKKIF